MRISQVLTNQPDSCDLVIKKFGSRTFEPVVDDEVVVKLGDDRIFAGHIIEVDEIYQTHNYVAYRVLCTDYTYHMDQKLVVEIYEGQTVAAIIQHLKDNYMPSDISIDYALAVTEVVDYAAFNYESVSDVLRQLAELVGADWYIDYNKFLHFDLQNSQDAPFGLTDTNGKYVYESLVLRRDQTQLRNIVFIRGGEYLGDTVTAVQDGTGAQRFFYLPYKMSNLTLTVTGASKSVGVDPINDPSLFDAMHNFQEKTVFFRSDKIPRDTSALAASQKVRIGGNPNLPVIAKVRDPASIETWTGREYVIHDPSIKSKDGAWQRGLAELLAYRDTISEAEFDTYETGLHTGQKMNIQSTIRGIDENYIINKVIWTVFAQDDGEGEALLQCNVSLVTTRTFGYTQLLQRLLNKEKKLMTVNEQELETVDTIETTEDSMTLSDTVTSHIDYGETYILGPWTGGFPHDTPTVKKRLFILNGSKMT